MIITPERKTYLISYTMIDTVDTYKNNRIAWLDFARTVAILCVVLCHVTEVVYHLDLQYMISLPVISRLMGLFFFTIGRFGVPLFLMISGYLLLDREYDADRTLKFYTQRWLHLLVCTWIWYLIIELFRVIYWNALLDVGVIIKEMLFISKAPMSHMWYMPMLLGMYMCIPFVAKAVRAFPGKVLAFPLSLAVFYAFVFPMLAIVNDLIKSSEPLANQFSLDFTGGIFGLCFIFGYLVKKGLFHRIKTIIIVTIVMSSFIIGIYMQEFLFERGIQYNIWYDNVFLVIGSVGIFELCSRIKNVKAYAWIRKISYYSFSIYLSHKMVMYLLVDHLERYVHSKSVCTVVLWILCFSISMIVMSLINRIPKVGKYILYTK